MQTEKLLLPRWIIPLEGDTEVLENYGLAIENGRIAALIPPADLKNVEAKEVFELPDNVVMPGFVNCHTHASMNLLRCVGPDLTAPNWLTKCIWPIEGQLMSPEFVYDGALLGGAEMLQASTRANCPGLSERSGLGNITTSTSVPVVLDTSLRV